MLPNEEFETAHGDELVSSAEFQGISVHTDGLREGIAEVEVNVVNCF